MMVQYYVIAICLLFSPYLHSKSKPAAPQKKSVAPQTKPAIPQAAPAVSQLSEDINTLIESTFPTPEDTNIAEYIKVERERIKIYEQLGAILAAILDKKSCITLIKNNAT